MKAAPQAKAWRPRNRGRAPGGTNAPALRPKTAEKYQCRACSVDADRRRIKCPKCGGKALEFVPAHTDVTKDDE